MRFRNHKRLIVFGLLLGGYLLIQPPGRTGAAPQNPAQPADTSKGPAVYDFTARSSTLREIAGEKVLELTDDVRITHEDIIATSRRGMHFNVRKLSYLIGDVKIVRGTMTMWADEGEFRHMSDLAVMKSKVRIVDEGWDVTCNETRYSLLTNSAWLFGNVVARDSSTTLYADSMYYDRENQLAEAFGNVHIINEDEGVQVKGKHAFYYRADRMGIIDVDPRLTVDPDSREPVIIHSDTMKIYTEKQMVLAYYRVKIIKGNVVTQCDSAVLYDAEDRAELYGSPLARQDRSSMSGNKMTLHYDDDAVYRIDIDGEAGLSDEQPDSLVIGRDSWIKGDTMSLYLCDNRVDSILVTGNATSEYYPARKGKKVESNFVRGDTMFFHFDNDSLGYVRITGNADGVYKSLNVNRDQTVDSLRAEQDTNLVYVPFRDKAEKVVYSAKRIEFFADNSDLVLNENAKIVYQGRILTGKDITYFSQLQLLDATGKPVLVDQGEKFHGERMNYDLEGGSGLVTQGSTQFQEGYYSGERVAKVGDNEMKVWNSRYTTCDLAEPHFHFRAKEMKVYPKDKVVSGPIRLYIGQTPIAYLPFMANNIERGRRSGILRPEFEFGITSSTGRYVRNFGYYWATNDYTDFTFAGDFNEEREFRVAVDNRYKLRYKFDGSVDYSFLRDLNTWRNQWTIGARHRHTLGERFTGNASLNFVSSDEAPRAISRIDNVRDVINRQIRSTASVSKTWNKMGLSASGTRDQRLNVTDPDVARVTTNFPNVRVSIPSRNLYFGEESKPGEGSVWEKLLKGIRYSPSLSGNRTVTEKEFEYKEVITTRQGLSFQSPQKVSFLTISPTLSASNVHTHTDEEITSHPTSDSTFVPFSRVQDGVGQFTWRTGANASTNLYGTFYPNLGALRGVRHTVSPNMSYSYTPEIGGRPSRQGIGVSLRNTIDLKVRGDGKGLEEGEEPEDRKLSGVAIWTLSSNYNPKAPKRRGWSNVSSSVNTRIFGSSISMNQTIDPYQGEILSTRVTSSFTLVGKHGFGKSESIEIRELNVVAAADTGEGQVDSEGSGADVEITGGASPEELIVEEGRLPWSLSMNVSYSQSGDAAPRSTMNLNGQTSLTDKWRISYSANYDVEARDLRGENYSITRDLHCWNMSFSRQKLGNEWQFYFKINLIAHPELYAEQGDRGLGGGSSFTGSTLNY